MTETIQYLQFLWNDLISHPAASLAVIGNLVIIESLLSVDNAAVLATMVMDLSEDERKKALKYGIIGAYVFRGLALLFATYLVQFWFLKPIGGLYLIFLVYKWWKGKQTKTTSDDIDHIEKKENWFYRWTVGKLGNFWATVVLVELVDMAFSIDNVFAAVAFSKNILVIWIGVFIGILSMRFVAQGFVKLMEKYTFLETCAFLVIFVLGIKLSLAIYTHYDPCSSFSVFMEGQNACLEHQGLPIPKGHATVWGDIITSFLTIAIFAVPVLTSSFLGWPKVKK
jgi:YkoY family integral membrane protein